MAEQTPETSGRSVKERVAEIINQIRPALQSDGGDVELVDVDEQGVVSLRLHGACVGCPSSTMTLAFGIERHLKEKVSEVSEVVCV